MLKQFTISPHAGRQIRAYLDEKGLSLTQAMDNEQANADLAAILHAGLPLMVRKIYSLPKFHTFFWEKRSLLATHLQARLDATAQPKRR